MQIDTDKIDEAVLALLFLTLHDGVRAWKSFDWDAMNRLHGQHGRPACGFGHCFLGSLQCLNRCNVARFTS